MSSSIATTAPSTPPPVGAHTAIPTSTVIVPAFHVTVFVVDSVDGRHGTTVSATDFVEGYRHPITNTVGIDRLREGTMLCRPSPGLTFA